MTTRKLAGAGGEPFFTPEEARVLGRATNVEMVGLLVSILVGFGAARMLNYSAFGIALGFAAFFLCEGLGRFIYWRITRPLAHLATGENPRFDRAWKSSRMSVSNMALAVLPLVAVSRYDFSDWWVAFGLIVAVAGNYLAEKGLHKHLNRLNARDAARGVTA